MLLAAPDQGPLYLLSLNGLDSSVCGPCEVATMLAALLRHHRRARSMDLAEPECRSRPPDVEDVARALRLFTSPEFRRRCKASSCIAGSYGRSAPVTIGGVRLSGDGAAGGPVQLPAGSRPTDGAAFGRIGSVGFPPPEVIRNL